MTKQTTKQSKNQNMVHKIIGKLSGLLLTTRNAVTKATKKVFSNPRVRKILSRVLALSVIVLSFMQRYFGPTLKKVFKKMKPVLSHVVKKIKPIISAISKKVATVVRRTINQVKNSPQYKKITSTIKRFVKNNPGFIKFATPLLFGFIIFWFVKPLLVKAVASEAEISVYTTYNDLDVATEVSRDKISQIVYEFSGDISVITDEHYTHANPKADGEYIAWMGQTEDTWHIFTHNVTTDNTNQLTFSGNNVNPDVSLDYVVWEGQVDGVWQILFFDGVKINQITHGPLPSQHPGVDGDYIVYNTMKESGGLWDIVLYDIFTGDTTVLTPNSYGWKPEIDGEFVLWHGSSDKAEVMYMYVIPTGDLYISSLTKYNALGKDAFDEYVANLSKDGTIPPGTVFSPETAQESTESTGSGTFQVDGSTVDYVQQVSKDDILLELEQLNQAAQESTSSAAL